MHAEGGVEELTTCKNFTPVGPPFEPKSWIFVPVVGLLSSLQHFSNIALLVAVYRLQSAGNDVCDVKQLHFAGSYMCKPEIYAMRHIDATVGAQH